MRLTLERKRNEIIKLLFFFKIICLLLLFVFKDRSFFVGERFASAKDSDKGSEDPGHQLEANKTFESKSNPNELSLDKVRNSFLSNLLEIPKLDTSTMTKNELVKYIELFERKERQVKERLQMLEKRELHLRHLEGSIEDKLKKIDEERKFLAQTIQQEKDLKNERVDHLIVMYSKMEPKKAAPVFEKLDKDLVVELFKKLPQKQVTAILELMNPEKSVQLSEYYGRVRSIKEYDILKELNASLRREFDDCKGMPQTQN